MPQVLSTTPGSYMMGMWVLEQLWINVEDGRSLYIACLCYRESSTVWVSKAKLAVTRETQQLASHQQHLLLNNLVFSHHQNLTLKMYKKSYNVFTATVRVAKRTCQSVYIQKPLMHIGLNTPGWDWHHRQGTIVSTSLGSGASKKLLKCHKQHVPK